MAEVLSVHRVHFIWQLLIQKLVAPTTLRVFLAFSVTQCNNPDDREAYVEDGETGGVCKSVLRSTRAQ
jgi:hypothetical protein